MQTKHTPGPWRVGMSNVLVWTGKAWAKMSGHHGGAAIGNEEARANMLLAAAAPDLLVELMACVANEEQSEFEGWLYLVAPSGDVESVQRQWKESSTYREFLEDTKGAREAIAKATGEQS